MRRSLLFGFSSSFIPLLFFVFHLITSGEAYPISHRNSTTLYRRQFSNICDIGNGIRGTDKLRRLNDQPFIARNNCPTNRGFFFNIANSKPSATTNIAQAGRMTRTAGIPSGNINCDHIVEINIVLHAIEQPGGLCEILNTQGFSPVEVDSELDSLRNIINSANNLVFVTNEVEINSKNRIGNKFQSSQFQATTCNKALLPSMQGLAGLDYLDQVTVESRAVADDIDREIAAILGGPPAAGVRTVRQIWDAFLTTASSCKAKTVVQARREQKLAQAQAAQTTNRGTQCGRGPVTKRSDVGPHLSPRQDPVPRFPSNSAPAPSCPAPGQPPKRVVPASEMTPKPGAANPIVAVNSETLSSNPPGPRRAVARPPNRQKRVPGQAAPRPSTTKRTKPSKKPRTVPKPADKPAGRARGRRG